jgi:hypothetical protein
MHAQFFVLLFFHVIKTNMDVPRDIPTNFASFCTLLASLNFVQLVQWCRDIGLLRSEVACPKCGTLTTLDLPLQDSVREKTRHTRCSNSECAKKSGYTRTIFYKHGSTFDHSSHDMRIIL